jgi:hypothetical protein
MAFTQNINIESDQTSPGYVLTFIRYSNRDTVNYQLSSEITRKPFVVVNDAVSVGVHYSKSDPVPTLSCSLKQGDINYLTAVHPGDYVFVNMVNWENKAMEIRQKALAGQPINGKNDGFKGLFKILDVNMALAVGSNGEKNYYVNVTARGFDEFNNVLYFNPALAELTDIAFLNNFKNWSDKVQTKGSDNVEELVKEAIKRSIGEESVGAVKGDLNQVPAYVVPKLVPSLLGLSTRTISGINKYYLGIWPAANSYNGFFKLDKGDFYKTNMELAGSKKVSFESFQNVKVWSLLQDFSNHQLNESYTCYRLAPDNRVYPSIVVRQKPFNTNHFENFAGKEGINKSINHTKFLNLPRWKISPDIITSLNIGRSDHGRINFVVVNSKTTSVDPKIQDAAQIVLKNYVADKKDIERNGRKPYIVNCYYDYPGASAEVRSKEWAVLIADWVFNGHLKMNGTIQSMGIQEPICVGDNLELDNVVYHIESITHNIGIDANGSKYFRTNLTLSYGVDLNSNTSIPVYAEMDNTDSFARRKDDFKKEKLLPGFSDSQDWPGRKDGEEIRETKQASFTNPKPINDSEVD